MVALQISYSIFCISGFLITPFYYAWTLCQRDATAAAALQGGARAGTTPECYWLRPAQAQRLDESCVHGVPGAECAMHRCLGRLLRM